MEHRSNNDHAACKVEFQPFNRSYSQLTFFNFLFKKIYSKQQYTGVVYHVAPVAGHSLLIINAFTTRNPFFSTHPFEVSIGRDLGALKEGLTLKC